MTQNRKGSRRTFALVGMVAVGLNAVGSISTVEAQGYGQNVQNGRNVTYGSFSLGVGQIHDIPVANVYVERMVVVAQSQHGGTVEVEVNGKNKGTLYVPASDPNHTVTIAEATDVIRFRHISGSGIPVSSANVTQTEGRRGLLNASYGRDRPNGRLNGGAAVGFIRRHYDHYFSIPQLDGCIEALKYIRREGLSGFGGKEKSMRRLELPKWDDREAKELISQMNRPIEHGQGGVFSANSDRQIFPSDFKVIEINRSHGESGMSGGPVYSLQNGRILGVLSHRVPVEITDRTVIDNIENQKSWIQNHLLVIPASEAKSWAEKVLKSPSTFKPRFQMKTLRDREVDRQILRTNGVEFEFEGKNKFIPGGEPVGIRGKATKISYGRLVMRWKPSLEKLASDASLKLAPWWNEVMKQLQVHGEL